MIAMIEIHMLVDLNISKHDISSSVQNRLSSLCTRFFLFLRFRRVQNPFLSEDFYVRGREDGSQPVGAGALVRGRGLQALLGR